jgi:hypothetical protein
MRWTTSTVAGAKRHCALLPDGRIAYVEPGRRPGMWLLRIVRRPGQRVADLYDLKPTAEAAMRKAEQCGRAAA